MFRRYYVASAASVQALWAQRVALGWLAWEVSASPGFVGLVAALSMAPTLISGPVFGVLVDRADILRAAGWSTLTMALTLLLAAIWHWTFGLDPTALTVLALAVGIISSAHHPVRMSLAPRLVGAPLVASVIALSAINFNTARLIAPIWAGLMLATLGGGWTLLVAAGLYVPLLLVLPGLEPRPLPQRASKPRIARALMDGIERVRDDPLLRDSILFMAVMAVLVRGYLEILPVLAEGVHGRGPAGLGTLTAAAGTGALLAAGAKAAGWGQITDRISLRLRAGLVVAIGSLLLIGWFPSWHAALLITAALGYASTFCGVTLQSVVQSNVEDDFRGRVMSLWVVTGFGAAAVGALGLGVLIEAFGFASTMMWAGAIGAGSMAVVTVLRR